MMGGDRVAASERTPKELPHRRQTAPVDSTLSEPRVERWPRRRAAQSRSARHPQGHCWSFAQFTGQGNSVSLPRFTVQRAKTQVRIRTGETIAIGGLVKEAASNTQTKVPILGDIPLVGMFFKNNSRYEGSDPNRQDLLVFLTVTVDSRDKKEGQEVAAGNKTEKKGNPVAVAQ